MVDNDVPIRLAVTGVTGRMGKELIRCIIKKTYKEYNKKFVLKAAIVRVGANICGLDVGTVINDKKVGVIVTDDLQVIKDNFDTLIDFTAPNISIEYVKFCLENNKNIVLGTTGFNKHHKLFIKDVSRKIGIVCAANFSIGINLILKLLHIIVQVIGNTADINIIETHHNKKIDAPSGTALMMQDIIVNTLTSMFSNQKLCCDVNGGVKYNNMLSLSSNVPIHSIRAGNYVGEHKVLFTSISENLQIIHTALNRSIFADGALLAAVWLGYKKGLFNMNDVLGI